jgi:hypothetical protein
MRLNLPIPSVKMGTLIKVVVEAADGNSYMVVSTKTKTTGTCKAPLTKFFNLGTHQVTVL